MLKFNIRMAKEGVAKRLPKIRPHTAVFTGKLSRVSLEDLSKTKLYTPIDVKTSQLKCRFIDDHPMFVELVQEIEQFNKELLKANKKETHMDKYEVKIKFYINLRK